MSLSAAEIEKRIYDLEAQVNTLKKNATSSTAASTKSTASTSGTLSSVTNLLGQLKQVLDLGFEWAAKTVSVQAGTAISVDSAGVSVMLKSGGGISADANGLYATGSSVVGIPAGGTTGQVLTKTSNTDYDVEWA